MRAFILMVAAASMAVVIGCSNQNNDPELAEAPASAPRVNLYPLTSPPPGSVQPLQGYAPTRISATQYGPEVYRDGSTVEMATRNPYGTTYATDPYAAQTTYATTTYPTTTYQTATYSGGYVAQPATFGVDAAYAPTTAAPVGTTSTGGYCPPGSAYCTVEEITAGSNPIVPIGSPPVVVNPPVPAATYAQQQQANVYAVATTTPTYQTATYTQPVATTYQTTYAAPTTPTYQTATYTQPAATTYQTTYAAPTTTTYQAATYAQPAATTYQTTTYTPPAAPAYQTTYAAPGYATTTASYTTTTAYTNSPAAYTPPTIPPAPAPTTTYATTIRSAYTPPPRLSATSAYTPPPARTTTRSTTRTTTYQRETPIGLHFGEVEGTADIVGPVPSLDPVVRPVPSSAYFHPAYGRQTQPAPQTRPLSMNAEPAQQPEAAFAPAPVMAMAPPAAPAPERTARPMLSSSVARPAIANRQPVSSVAGVSASAARGEYKLIPALDVPPGNHPNDFGPSQWFEVVRPGNGPVRIGRLSATCVCVGARIPKRHYAAGERILVEARMLSKPPVNNVTYGIYVNILEPVETVVDADVTLRY